MKTLSLQLAEYVDWMGKLEMHTIF